MFQLINDGNIWEWAVHSYLWKSVNAINWQKIKYAAKQLEIELTLHSGKPHNNSSVNAQHTGKHCVILVTLYH